MAHMERSVFARAAGGAMIFGLVSLSAIGPAIATSSAPLKVAQNEVKRTETTTYDNWTVICNQSGKDKTSKCFARMVVIGKDGRTRLLVWRVGYNPKNELIIEMITPTNVYIEPGVTLKIDEGKPIKLAYTTCGAQGCKATLKLGRNQFSEISAGKRASVGITGIKGKSLQFGMDIKGVKPALDALNSK